MTLVGVHTRTTLSVRRGHLLAGLGLLAYVAWCLTFIWKSSFVIDGQRYFCLFDDGMISLSFARNLAEGHGLTWARWGEPVEGFTPPLWTVGMVLTQLWVIPLWLRPLLVQLTCMALLLTNIVLVFRLCRRHLCPSLPGLAWVGAFATAVYYPLNFWALAGMETGLQAVLLTLAVSLAFDLVHGERQRVIKLCCVVSAAVLLRPDMLIGGALIVGYAVVFGGLGRARLGQWLCGAAIFCAVVGGYELFRVLYYGDVLPNTYWLKMTGGDVVVRIKRGLLVFLDVARCMPSVLVVGLVGGLLTGFVRRRHLLLVALVAGYFSYSVYVGGDMYEFDMTGNRFVCFVLPMLAVLIVGVVDAAASRWPGLGAGGGWRLGCGVGLWLFVSLNGLLLGPNSETRRGYVSLEPPGVYARHGRVITDILRLKSQLPPDTKVAVIWAGITSYFSDFRMVDTLGYNDREVAVRPWAVKVNRANPRKYVPGHMKWDLDFTLKTRQPDVFFQALPQWAPKLREAGYRRFDTGSDVFLIAGEMWVRPPLTLDTSPWQG